ncbi:MAG: hypothetical protein M1834_009019 [Cirrosporium novae-zelandiae]|nr:MAG: hypothetical protein M1834_009019 [Cirrosporium novae-zelandiae]
MGYCYICFLCGKSIDSKYTGRGVEAWRSWFQTLQLDESNAGNYLIGPSDTYIRTQNVVHAACWIVVTAVLGTSRIDARWLDKFYHVLRDMEPFMTSIKFDQSPDALDHNLNREFSNIIDSNSVKNLDALGNNPHRKSYDVTKSNSIKVLGSYLEMPHEIIQIIYLFLDSYKDICSFQQVIYVEPSDKIWLSLGHKYLAVDMQQPTYKAEIIRSIKQALTNLHYFPSSFPHATNYATVLNNTKLLLSKMRYSLAGKDIDITISGRDIIFSNPKALLSKQRMISWNICQMEFNFSCINTQHYLCGLCYEDLKLGYDGDLTVKVSSKYFCGIRLINNGKGFVAIQIKDQSKWGPILPRGITEMDSSTFVYTQLEWPLGYKNGAFIFFFDAIKICALAFAKNKSIISLAQPVIWQSRLPLQKLKPVILIDCAGEDRIYPYTFIDCNITAVTAVNVFVDQRTEAISAIEFVIGPNNILSIGHELSSAAKLSFHLDSDKRENIIGLTFN